MPMLLHQPLQLAATSRPPFLLTGEACGRWQRGGVDERGRLHETMIYDWTDLEERTGGMVE